MELIKYPFLVSMILKILLLSELFGKLFAIPTIKQYTKCLNKRSTGLSYRGLKSAQNYLYLNYKETYGIRFDPNKIRRKHFTDHSSSDDGGTVIEVNTDPCFQNNDPSGDGGGSFGDGNDPNIGSNDPNVNNNEPGVDNNDWNVGNNDPNMDNPNNDPNMGNWDTNGGSGKPGIDNNEPNDTNVPNGENPNTDNNIPDMDYNDPTGGNNKPNVDDGDIPMEQMPPNGMTTMASNGVDMVSIPPPVSSMETQTTPSNGMPTTSPGMMDGDANNGMPSITTTKMSMGSNEMPSMNSSVGMYDTRVVLSFPSLINKINPSKRKNNTMFVPSLYRPSISPLKNTLNLIKKRIKQWLHLGTDFNASLVNGQRFLNVFNVIKFESGPCTSTQEGLTEMTGTCYQDYQCSELGGVPIDECADGLGVCCIFKSDCGQSTNQMTSYFQNPGWPSPSQDRLICTLTVELQKGVRQVLLDFVSFELKPPLDGNCEDDQFLVAGQNLNNQIPTICGVNNGQHMYVEVDNASERKLFLSILTTGPGTRAFNLRVTQLTAPVAPNNCLQYYTDLEGWFQTFNYDDASQFIPDRNPTYFNNLNYVICIKREWNYCSVSYSNVAEKVEYDFQLLNVDSEGMSLIPEKQAGLEIFNCNDDYISVNSIRLCGEKLNDASNDPDLRLNSLVTDITSGLNIIPVHTNDMIVGRGFRINYKQIPCNEQPERYDSVEESTETEMPTNNEPISKYGKQYLKLKIRDQLTNDKP